MHFYRKSFDIWHMCSLWQDLSYGTMSWSWQWPLTYFKVKFVAERGTTIRVPTVLEKSLNFGFSLKSPWKWICPWKVLECRGLSLKFQLVVLDFLFCVFWTESLNGYSKLSDTRANFPPKNSARFARSSLQVKYFFQFLFLVYNSRRIVIISFLSQEYLQVFMYIMCFNVSICFKMGSLYSYCDIKTS